MRILSLLPALVITLGLLTACSPADANLDAAPATRTSKISVKDMKFSPRVIEVPTGTTVTWSFQDDDTRHDVKGERFKSDVLRSGTFTHTFGAPGVYDYHCSLHSQMTGRVIVTN